MRMFLLFVGLVATPLSEMVLATDPVPAPMLVPPTPLNQTPPKLNAQVGSPIDPAPVLPPQNQTPEVPPARFEAPSPLSTPMPLVAPGLLPPVPLKELPVPNQTLVPTQQLGDPNQPLPVPTPGPRSPIDPTPVHPPFPMPAPDPGPTNGIGNSSLFTAKLREPAPGDDELQRLLIARYNEAVKELRTVTAAYQYGISAFENIINAAEHVLKAGLELGEKPADQIAMLEQYLDYTKQNEANVKSLYDTKSRGGEVDKMCQATYLRLGAEIELLRAKRKASLAK